MKILLTNDDGVNAQGIQILRKNLEDMAEIVVVAPSFERSCTGHGITTFKPIRAQAVQVEDGISKHWSVIGTPADCVKLALETLMESKPDLIISGINQGTNLATEVLYSGTVSAAMEGVLYGIPSIAVSAEDFTFTNLETAAVFIKKFIQEMFSKKAFSKNYLYNINIPPVSLQDIENIAITSLGRREYQNPLEEREDPWGRKYYWLGGNPINHAGNGETDVDAFQKRMISVTPIHYDLTDYEAIKCLKKINLNKILGKES